MVNTYTKTCKACSMTFRTNNTYYTVCPDCHNKRSNSNSKVCILCKNNYHLNNVKRNDTYKYKIVDTNRNKKCGQCIGKSWHTCSYCSEKYIGYWKNSNDLCVSCNVVKKKLHSGNMTSDMIVTGFNVVVTYDVHREEHDGYCSDPEETTVEDSEVVQTYPLLTYLNKHLDDDGNISGGQTLFYEIDTEYHGNGHCGLQTTYRPRSIKVVNLRG